MGNLESRPALGFLTVTEEVEHGLFGGYLVLNLAGRPLEFHCTAPIRPNRAQQILYGPTLQPYLFGEQIGQTLVSKAKTKPLVVCTDREPALAMRDCVNVPVVLVLPREESDSRPPDALETLSGANQSPEKVWRVDGAHLECPLATFQVGRNRLAVADSQSDDRRLVSELLSGLSEWFDLSEPFGRIREAIQEARQGRQ